MSAAIRWVGFDMDECIGSVMPLYSFITQLPVLYAEARPDEPAEAAWTLLQRALVQSELSGKTWLLRPALIDALDMLYKAWKAKRIQGAFIYSNNGSERLVRFVGFLLNGILAAKNKERNTRLFQMGIHLKAPCRTRGSTNKTFADIQACLTAHGLPQASSADDLLFFDDLTHVLTREITHYVQVRPYMNQTSVYSLLEVLDFFRPIVGETAFKAVFMEAARDQMDDMERDGQKILVPPTVDELRTDSTMFNDAFRRFFRVSQGGGRTRRRRRMRRHSKNIY